MARLARLAAPALASLAVAGCAGDDEPTAAAPVPAPAAQAPPPAAEPEPEPARTVLVVRRRGGVPERWARRLARTPGVETVTRVARTQLLSTTGAPRAGYAYLLDAVVVTPRAFAAVAGVPAAGDVRGGRVLLSETSARLRDLQDGDRIRFTRGAARVAGVVPDAAALGAEVVVSGADVPAGDRRNAQLLVATTDPARAARAVPEDRLTRVSVLAAAAPSPTPTLGGIARPMELKQRFGEFAVRLPLGADWIAIDPGWVRRNIVTRRVPILGNVTCHRAFVGPLRRVLTRVARRGLARLVDPGDFAGCYAPRRIPASGSLSLHAWGLAIDLNASENPQGARPRQDLRLVHLFEDEGFTWGGRWPTAPDGMHFELHGDPGQGVP